MIICSRTAQKWLNKLEYKYEHVKKNLFIDGHEKPDVIKNQKNFLEIIEKLKPYLVKFDKIGQMILNIHPSDYKIKTDKYQPVIIIIYNKYTFSFNNGF